MKKKLLLLPFILVLVYVGLSSNSNGPATSGSNYTTAGCTGGGGCHTNSTTTAVTIELDSAGIPVTHYVAGQSYRIKIRGVNTTGTFTLPRFGFQLAAVNTGGTANAGTLATVGLPPSTHNLSVGGINIFEHTTQIAGIGGGGAGTVYADSINWTAPATGFGSVKLNGSLNAVDFTGGTGGDQCKLATATLTEIVAPITGSAMTMCVGSLITLADATTGGTWSSGATGIATVTSGGVVTGVAPGTAVISYVTAVGTATATVTVNPLPSGGTISGTSAVCVGASVTLTDVGSVGTGVWSTTTPAITTINASGVVTGVGAGVGTIRYTATNSCGSNFATYSVTVDPLPNAGNITGTTGLCIGGAGVTLSNATGDVGGTWSIDLPAVATVNISGHVTGISGGTAIVTYAVTNPCGSAQAVRTVTVSAAPDAGVISGSTTVCRGSTVTLTDAGASGFGTWSSTNNAIATVSVTTGAVHAVAAGADTIRFIVVTACGSDTAFYPITVNPLPNAGSISGTSGVCVGSTITLTNTGSVGTGSWGTTTPGLATVDASGVVSGLVAGTAFITYTATNGCGTVSTGPFTVAVQTPLTAGPLSGSSSVCAGANTTLTGVSAGGGWISGSTAIATVNAAGMVHGVSAGSTTITYAVGNSCGTDTAYMPMTVNPLPVPGTLSGASTVCVGATTTLTPTVGGGAWSSTVTSVATVNGTGMVTGVLSGTTLISYSVSNGCGTLAATKAMTVNTVPSAGVISGATTVCVGAQITLGESVGGGTWSNNPTTTATITSGGVVTGVLAGTTIVTYTVSNICGSNTANRTITVNPLPVPGVISGTSVFCAGTSVTMTTTGSGGSWSSSAGTIATVNSVTGMVTGLLGGTATISYIATNSCGTLFAIRAVTVDPATTAGTITGSSFACIGGGGVTLSNAASGGTWSINPTSVATIDVSGVVFPVSIGSANVTYTVSGTCGTATVFYPMTVGTAPAVTAISGPSSVCQASSITLTNTTGGGIWSSSNVGIATVNGSGVVTGTGGGVATISYSISTACGFAFAVHDVTVNPLPNAGAITGAVNLCEGASTTLAESASGGTWSSSPTTVAIVNASGVVTGVSGGVVVIAYTVSNVCGTTLAAHTMTVSPLPTTGTISGPTSQCQGTIITLVPSLPGGVWSASNGNASVSAGGLVTGVSFGLVAIYYSFTNACGTAHATLIDTIYPTSIVGGIIGDDTVCQGDTVHLSTLVSGGTWTVTNTRAFVTMTGDVVGVTPGADTVVYTLTNMCGTYTAMLRVLVRSSAACAAGVVTTEKANNISVYPNPAEGVFTVEIPETNEDATITVYDVFGKVIERRVVDNTTGSKTLFNMSSIASGNYIVKVTSGTQNFIQKIVIR